MPDAPASPVAARIGYLRAALVAAISQPEAFDLPVLLGDWGKALDVLGILLDAHTPLTLYASAEDCGHPGPPETGAGGYTPWDEWHDNHPRGSGPADLVSGERVCLLTHLMDYDGEPLMWFDGSKHGPGVIPCGTYAAVRRYVEG